jgi:CheY-like chemotaxis protein
MASGAPPFSNADLALEAQGHATQSPPRVADLRPDLPGELSDLIDWLLIKEPTGRPRSVGDVLAQLDAIIERLGSRTRSLRVLIVDDDTARARWLWSLARRAHAAAIVEISSEGTDAAHKLNRDQPDLVFIDASLRGVMNALELCMYACGLEGGSGQMCVIGNVTERDRTLFAEMNVPYVLEDSQLPNAILKLVRDAIAQRPRSRRPHSTVSG